MKKNESDSFWDTKWEAMELQKKADIHEKKGKHFLADEFKRKAAKDKRDSTPSLSPENRSPSPECDELKRINKIKDIQVRHYSYLARLLGIALLPSFYLHIDIIKYFIIGTHCARIRKICG